MLTILKLIFFFLCCISFGFILLNQLTKIRSLLLLLPLSLSFGLASFIFVTHILSYLLGPQLASIVTLFLLLFTGLIIFYVNKKSLTKIEAETNKSQLIIICFSALIVSVTSFLAIFRFGVFDGITHTFFSSSMYHNNIYPPRDPFRPDYVLMYHWGSDLLAGAIHYLCNIEISRSFELVSSVSSGVTFSSFLSLAWILTKNLKLSFLAGFCTYFGGGLLWLDAILRYISNNLPQSANWSFLQTFFNLGTHGGILNAPSVSVFVPTFSLGYPILILSLILFWKIVEEKDSITNIFNTIFLSVSLFTLFFSAKWLYVTFWASVIPFIIYLLIRKQKINLLPLLSLFLISVILSKTIGNELFLQEEIQGLGRSNIFNIALKEKPFWIMGWGRLNEVLLNYQPIFVFSWDFLAEFGLSLILLPVLIIFLFKTKNSFAILLFLCALVTMPVPLIIDFKTEPVDLNRFFTFGNTMLILLITCGIAFLYKNFLKNRLLIITYILVFCLSPLSELLSSTVFTPAINFDKKYISATIGNLSKAKSIKELTDYFSILNNKISIRKKRSLGNYTDVIDFLRLNSKSNDVALSSFVHLPMQAGIYTLVPAKIFVYKDQMYSTVDSIVETTFSTLDPYLLHELNIKWIVLDKENKDRFPTETKNKLANEDIFRLAYVSKKENNLPDKKQIEIYHVNEVKDLQVDYLRKTAWLLLDENGQPIIELASSNGNKIRLFPSSRNALLYLKDLYSTNPNFKKKLITAQAIPINSLEEQITRNKLNIALDKRF